MLTPTMNIHLLSTKPGLLWAASSILGILLAAQASASPSSVLELKIQPTMLKTTGVGIAITWNSAQVDLTLTNIYQEGSVIDLPREEPDHEDIDEDPKTDRLIRLAWMSISGDWRPGHTPLAEIRLRMRDNRNHKRPFRIIKLSGDQRIKFALKPTLVRLPHRSLPTGEPKQLPKPSTYLTKRTTSILRPPVNSLSARAPASSLIADRGNCSPDFDENNSIDALTDGLLLIRKLFGLSGESLIANAVGSNALISSSTGISAKLNNPGCTWYLDVDGNGILDALTDGLLFIRWAFGVSGDSLIQGALGPGAVRTSSQQIIDHLASQPVLPPAMAARFLTQATFGPDRDSIAALSQHPGGIRGWLSEQFNLPFTPQLPQVKALTAKMCHSPSGNDTDTWFSPGRHQIWWHNVLKGEDQLRQRVAFALSQILVVSDDAPGVDNMQYGLTSYYDLLLEHAFGNYRDLLEAVALHPVMGVYLSMVRNEKADPARNIRPDENFARELMQLFSIGVYRMNLDGSLQLDANGQPIPNYDQQDIEELARVLTGWNYTGIDWWDWPGHADTTIPMTAWQLDGEEVFHDTGEKILLDGQVVPAGGSAQQDLDIALDYIFSHQNVAPMISRILIQRLVTSNPSPAYIERVATVFNDNGNGVKGDLKAVVEAILLDEEARIGHLLDPNFGKLREPLLRFSHHWRAFNAQPVLLSGRFWEEGSACNPGETPQTYEYYRVWWRLYRFGDYLGQQILGAPSVFNFHLPDYSPPGEVRDAGLVAPEFQTATENYVVNAAHALNSQIQEVSWDSWPWTVLDLSYETQLAADTNALLDHLDLVMMNGQMPDDLRNLVRDHLNNARFVENRANLDRARDAVMLIGMSPDYLIQR